MTDKTWDAIDSKDLPYRITYDAGNDEIFILTFTGRAGITMLFENHFAFHRFIIECLKLDDALATPAERLADEILRNKQVENTGG